MVTTAAAKGLRLDHKATRLRLVALPEEVVRDVDVARVITGKATSWLQTSVVLRLVDDDHVVLGAREGVRPFRLAYDLLC